MKQRNCVIIAPFLLASFVGVSALATAWTATSAANASSGGGFGEHSLRGRYASFVGGDNGFAPGAALLITDFNGTGIFRATGFTNLPAPAPGQRMVVPFHDRGTYTIDPDGIGESVSESGSRGRGVICRTEIINGLPVATEFFSFREQLGPLEGIPGTRSMRLPDQASFDDASLDGSYSLENNPLGGARAVAGVASLRFDGRGEFKGKALINLPSPNPCERNVVEAPTDGEYEMDERGFGTVHIGQLGDGIMLITAASEANGGGYRADEFIIVLNELGSSTGNLPVFLGSRIAD